MTVLMERTEPDLIREAKAGDRIAFAELLRPVYEAAIRLAGGLLHDPDEAEDAVQEAALQAWRKLGNLREGASLRPWFLGIVANRCRTIKRSRWSAVLKLEPDRFESTSVEVADAVDLRRALLRLDYEERLVLVLRFYVDMPYEDIAAALGLSIKATRKRVERAVQRLRPIVRIQGAAV